jgi:kumamolisin
MPLLAALYKFPTQFNGAGQTIALIELGGGFREADLVSYFKSLGIPMPRVSTMSIGGAQNSPSGPNSADGQVELDIEVAGAVAPGAHIVVYFCPNTNGGFLQGINAAINNLESPTSVLSISWGGPEPSWTENFMQQMNTAFQSASLHGITILAAAGDNGPNDGTNKPAVDFPSSSPWVTGVGGTRIHASATELLSEVAWDDGRAGGGVSGVSGVFPIPDWQAHAGIPKSSGGFVGRGTPDVAADASPNTGYKVQVDGVNQVVGGTAASTPFWAGLIALLNQAVGHNIGFFNPILYEKLGPASVLRPVSSKNGSSPSKPSWNPQTGWGSPNGEKLLEALKSI